MFLNLTLISKKIHYVIIIFFLIDLGFCSAYIINHLIEHPFNKLNSLLNLESEASLATWYSSTQYFCIFILSAIYCYHKIRINNKSFLLIGLPIMFLLLSIDESVQIHEWLGFKSDFILGRRKNTPFPMTGIWMFVIGVPFLALFLLYVHSLKQYIHKKKSSLKKLVIGMVIMLTGALGFELLYNYVEENILFITVVLEEGLEMIGATIMLWAVFDMAIEFMPDLDKKNV